MSGTLSIEDLVFASANRQKLVEFRTILGLPDLAGADIQVAEFADVNLENLVRRKIAEVRTKLPSRAFFVDHTGLIIDQLNELPAGQTSHWLALLGPEKLCRLLDGFKSRSASVKTVIGYYGDGESHIFEGSVFGEIAEKPRGRGDGFDTIFIQNGFKQTYAELGNGIVYRHSMRRVACKTFGKFLEQRYDRFSMPPLVGPRTQPMQNDLAGETRKFDFFLSHASEDKNEVARPLYEALSELGYSVWFDEAEIKVGDRLRRKIDEGLSIARFGIVILSPQFFAKKWPENELDALFARESATRKDAILPVWHQVDADAIRAYSLMLAGRRGAQTSDGILAVAEQLADAAGPPT
jgi:non-canonical purine NTP pyrophosphatase (RdgB/HAM1 family)